MTLMNQKAAIYLTFQFIDIYDVHERKKFSPGVGLVIEKEYMRKFKLSI